MSDIPYPHTAEVWRTNETDDPGDLNPWGNPNMDALPELVDTIACWIQIKPVQQQVRIQHNSDQEDWVASHTVFCEPRVFLATDYLVSVEGGGQVGDERFRILAPNNPDGGTDHLEIDCLRVTRGA